MAKQLLEVADGLGRCADTLAAEESPAAPQLGEIGRVMAGSLDKFGVREFSPLGTRLLRQGRSTTPTPRRACSR